MRSRPFARLEQTSPLTNSSGLVPVAADKFGVLKMRSAAHASRNGDIGG